MICINMSDFYYRVSERDNLKREHLTKERNLNKHKTSQYFLQHINIKTYQRVEFHLFNA